MKGKFDFSVDKSSIQMFSANCNATLTKVGNGSRKALQQALEDILDESLNQVPVETGTLMDSASYEITGHYKTGWEGKIGYGMNIDAVNPNSGKPASSYAAVVHEDLSAKHPVGKAKFLEDPVRAYAKSRFPRTVFDYVKDSLAD